MAAEATGGVRVKGVVVRGDGRGRQLGFPTANVAVPAGTRLPSDGIYAGWLERADGCRFLAAVSVGTRPTYYDGEGAERLVEAYLLDFDGDLYGETVRVGVGEMVRGQVRFESPEELVAQMGRDVAAVRLLSGPVPDPADGSAPPPSRRPGVAPPRTASGRARPLE